MESNDSKEIIYNNDYIRNYLDVKIRGFCKRNHIISSNQDKLRIMIFNAYSSFFEQFYYRAYVCCFSFEGDILSQWRGYAADGKGYAIGFDLDEMQKIGLPEDDDPISTPIFEPGKVVYKENEQKKIVRQIINAIFKRLDAIYKEKGFNVPEFLAPVDHLFYFLYKYAFFFKSDFFSEEKEWRLCFPAQKNSKVQNIKMSQNYYFSDMSYFLRDNKFVSYVDLHFDQNPKVVKEVIIGPKNDSNMVKEFLEKNGINVTLKKSRGTYR